MIRVVIILILSLYSVFSFGYDTDEAMNIFNSANEAYKAENYEEALELYLQLEEEYSSFEFYYNIGNTYYKLDEIPSAILYYEKAHKIEPNNDDLETNLMIANQFIIDKIDAIPLSNVNNFWNRIISENNLFLWSTLTIVCVFLSFGMFGWYIYRKKRKALIGLGVVILMFGLVNFFLGWMTVNRMDASNEAIIFDEEVEVLSQPNGSQTEFVIHEGTKVQINESDGEWSEIKIANGNVGWIKKTSYKEI